jgi:hypothetical protein
MRVCIFLKKVVVMKALFLAVLFVLSISGGAFADWNQGFQQASTEFYNNQPVGDFNEIKIWLLSDSASKFQSPAFTDFTTTGWSNYGSSSYYADAVKSLGSDSLTYFNLNFTGNSAQGAHFLSQTLLNSTVIQRQEMTYTPNSGWSYPGVDEKTWNGLAQHAVAPEPVSCVLFLLGGGSLAILRYRRKKP